MTTTERLRRAWLDHPYFRYRGCAPDPDDPMRMAGNPDLHVGAHHGPDAFVPEGQRERRAREDAAIEVCVSCPVMVACDAYASSVTADGRLAEPDGVWGGRRALDRHKALIKARHAAVPAPDRVFQTEQKRAVLRALARCWEPFEVAAAAGVDVRTANWQRSSLVRLLGLPKGASRMRALAAARERGLLEGVELVPDDGSVPAVPPPTPVKAPAAAPVAGSVAGVVSVSARRAAGVAVLSGRRARRRVQVMPGQLSLDDALAAPAAAVALFPARRLEAAA
jgi:hypothetical protein